MDADLRPLDDIIERLRAVDQLGAEVAVEVRPELEQLAQETAAAGTTPGGDAWATTRDGRRALPNAARAIKAIVSGTTKAVVTLVLSGPYVYHHGAKGKRRRQILPSLQDGIPKPMVDAVQAAASRVVARLFGGRR